MKKRIVSCCFLALLMPFATFAHPGHGDTDGYTIIHYFREPVHAVVPLVVIITIVAFVLISKKKYQRTNKH